MLINARNCLVPRLRSFRTVGAFCVTLFVTTASAFAEDSQIGILGDDDRRMIEERGTPWSAIGQINVTGYRRITWCTGSLVATNLVVTAAHCIMNLEREALPATSVTFFGGRERLKLAGSFDRKVPPFSS